MYLAFIFITFCFTTVNSEKWECPSNSVLNTGSNGKFPSSGDGSYASGMNCKLLINIPDDRVATINWESHPSPGYVLTAENDYMNLNLTGVIDQFFAYGPSPLELTIVSQNNSTGSLKFQWNIKNVDFSPVTHHQIDPWRKDKESFAISESADVTAFTDEPMRFIPDPNEKIVISTCLRNTSNRLSATSATVLDGNKVFTLYDYLDNTFISSGPKVKIFYPQDNSNVFSSVNTLTDISTTGEYRVLCNPVTNLFLNANSGPSVIHFPWYSYGIQPGLILTSELIEDSDATMTLSSRRFPIYPNNAIMKIKKNSVNPVPLPIFNRNGNTLMLDKGKATISLERSTAGLLVKDGSTEGVVSSYQFGTLMLATDQVIVYNFRHEDKTRRACFTLLDYDFDLKVRIGNSSSSAYVELNQNETYCTESSSNEYIDFHYTYYSPVPISKNMGLRVHYNFTTIVSGASIRPDGSKSASTTSVPDKKDGDNSSGSFGLFSALPALILSQIV